MKLSNILFVSITLSLFSCGSKDKNTPTPTPATAKAMFVNATVGLSAMRVDLNDVVQPGAESIALLASTGYLNIEPGSSKKTELIEPLSGLVLLTNESNYTVNQYQSFFSAGSLVDPIVVSVMDDLTAPASGKAKVRFVNLSIEDLSENVAVGSTIIGTGIAYKTATNFIEMNAGTFTINASDPADISLNLQKTDVAFADGKIYTIILTGNEDGIDKNALQLTVISNN